MPAPARLTDELAPIAGGRCDCAIGASVVSGLGSTDPWHPFGVANEEVRATTSLATCMCRWWAQS